ncbi:MAG: hypothetical protein GC185_11250 [Alphaproteobacteria bacterium]|nr:hypothetical protein [Alphaproteobacteria bacterium]
MSFSETVKNAFNDLRGVPPRERSEAEIFLTNIGVPHKVYSDGSIFVPGNVSLAFRPVVYENKALPDFSKVYIAGDFRCDSSNLPDLKGCPPYIGGDFYAGGNDFKNLEYGPAYVGGNYEVAGNMNLETIEDRAYHVGGRVNCINTRIGDYRGYPSDAELARSDEAIAKAREKFEASRQAKAYDKVSKARRPMSYDEMTVKELPPRNGKRRNWGRGK